MPDVIQTADGPKTLSVCKDGTTDNEDWIALYERFWDDRLQRLQKLLTKGAKSD